VVFLCPFTERREDNTLKEAKTDFFAIFSCSPNFYQIKINTESFSLLRRNFMQNTWRQTYQVGVAATLGSNLCRDIGYPDQGISWVSSVLTGKFRASA
jgi:hypothetical protein